MLNKIKFIAVRAITATLVLAFLASPGPSIVMAAPADASITVTNASSDVYADKGRTYLSIKTDVYVTAKPDVTYYILSAGYVDIYYRGAPGAPVGSYFPPPYEPGAWVSTIGGNTNTAPKAELSAANDWKIPIPLLMPGEAYELRIMAVKDGAEDAIFGHTFIGADYVFHSEVTGSTVVSSINSANAISGFLVLAIYQNRRLKEIKAYDFTANPSDTTTFEVDFTKYPIGEYEYQTFCWGSQFQPLAPAISLN